MNLQEIATKADIEALRKEIEQLRALLKEKEMMPTGYVSRTQALSMLSVKPTTLWRLTVKDRLIGFTGKGKNALFSFSDIKSYLQSKHLQATALNKRIHQTQSI